MQNSQGTAQNKASFLRRFVRSDEVSVTIPLLAIIFVTTLIRPDFLTIKNFSAMFTQIPFIAVCALGAAFPLMTGNVDISTGRVAGFAGIITASFVCDYGWSGESAILFSLACCVVIGLVNGLLVVHFGVPDFVATMGTMYIIGGARYLFIKGYQFALDQVPGFPYTALFDRHFLGMLPPFWIMLILFTIAFVVIKKTLWGRRMLATGDNREVAVLAGINTKRMRMAAYVISSFLSGVAGIMLTLDYALGLPENGDGWEFRAIAACVVGGVSLSGGKGSPVGILIGVLLVFAAENAIIFLGLPTSMRIAVQGALMAGAVLFDIYKQKRKVPA